ncbi:hypothetical protein [Cryptosporidium hominis TU502]|uniref:hypothetical protein n=1 Tax=Cryptosporidium hominis (strain TU502) TaxID=353151 RepID=UPI00004535C4|nr:hypothetical protein [Cryptosporidium hominis TU502]
MIKNDIFSASIVLQVIPLIFEKDILVLFPSFSDTHMILEIQKICEKIVESKDSRRLFIQQIDSNLSCYSFGNFIKESDIDSKIKSNNQISSKDILFSLISLPSIQSLSSKFPAIKLKAEQFLVFLIKLIIKLREDEDQHMINKNDNNNGINDEEFSQFELVISDIINVIEKIYPGHLNQKKVNFIKEYSRRVLSKAIN